MKVNETVIYTTSVWNSVYSYSAKFHLHCFFKKNNKKTPRTIQQILGKIRTYEQTITANETYAFQHDQKHNKILTDLWSLNNTDDEIEDVVILPAFLYFWYDVANTNSFALNTDRSPNIDLSST